MKRIYEWITKANQVLLFFGFIALVGFLAYVISSAFRPYEPPHVAVAQTPEEAKESVVRDVHFLSSWPGIYALGIMKRVVNTGKESWRKAAYLGSEEAADRQMVNVVFSDGDKRLRTLLPSDGLVLTSELYDEQARDKVKASLFLCVTEDTDGNHRLDENDRTDLYVLAPNLDRPDIVVKGAVGHRQLSPTHLAVKTGEGSAIRFWDLDIETGAQKEIMWK